MATDTITPPKGFVLETDIKPPEGFVLEEPVGFAETVSPKNWQDQLSPKERAVFDALQLDGKEADEIYDILYFSDVFKADPNGVSFFLTDLIETTGFQPHKDAKPYDGRKRLTEAVKHGYRRAGVMMVKQLAGLAKIETELGGRFRDWAWEKTVFGRPEWHKEIDKRLVEWSDMMLAGVQEYYRAYPEEAIQIAPELGYLATLKEYVTKPENLVQGIVESLPLMLEGILGTVTGTMAAGIVTMAIPITGEVYADARKEGTEPLPSLAQAVLTGTGEATIEIWTLGRKLGLLRNFRKLVAGGLSKILWEGTKAFFRGTAEEGSQEFNRNFWRWVFTDRSQAWLENVTESMAAGGPIEMVMAGGFSAAGAVAMPISKNQQIHRIEKIRTAVNENTELTDEHKAEINKELNQVTKDVQADVYSEEVLKEAEKPPVKPTEAPEVAVRPPMRPVAAITPTEPTPAPKVKDLLEGKLISKKDKYIAAFRHLETGEVYETGTAHFFDKLPEKVKAEFYEKPTQLTIEPGFVDKDTGKFITSTDALRAAEAEPIPTAPEIVAEKPAKPVVKEVIEPSQLRQRIHAVAATKGLTKKALTELKKKYTGYSKLTSKIAEKKITTEQLQSLLKAVQKTRPKRVGYKRVVTRKTEKKIQSLRDNLKQKLQMTDEAFTEILQKEVYGKEPRYVDAKHFITETEGKDIIRRMLDEAEVIRVTEGYEKAIRQNEEIGEQVRMLDRRIAEKPKRDPWSLESMRHYNQQAEVKTGAPFYAMYMDLLNTHLDSVKTRTATWKRLENTIGKEQFRTISKDNVALKRVSDYIVAQSALKERPISPVDITDNEVKLAKEIQAILKDYQLRVRVAKFFNFYYYNQPIAEYDRFKREINKATDIFEGKGKEELIEYLKTQEWGVIRSGYEPLEVLTQKVRLYTTGPTAVGKGHIKIRTDIEYHSQERNILQRLSSYMRQVDMLYNMSPKINAFVRLYDDNLAKFKNPDIIKGNIETFLRNIKRYNIQGGFFEKLLSRLYAQAMRVIIMPSPVLSFRNLFQNAAFEHDKSILIDLRNKPLGNQRIEFLETYVLQTRAMIEEYFMVAEKPFLGLRFLSGLIDKIRLYPHSDIANRHWSFWAKINQVDRALEAETTAEMMKQARFDDITELEQRRALGILAKDGKEAMAQYVARVHVDDIHFLYERSQRSPAEMDPLGKVVGNLFLFPRAYGEKLAHAANKMLKGKTYAEQWRGLKILFAVIAGGMICGAIFRRVTGRRKNPYDPLEILSYEAGGLAWGAVEAANDIYADMLLALKGDERALAALTTAIPRAADMFIPFYDYALRGIEAATDQKNVDRKVLRQIRMMIDKEYHIRGGAYKVRRNALEKWQYFIAGAGVDAGKKGRPLTIKR